MNLRYPAISPASNLATADLWSRPVLVPLGLVPLGLVPVRSAPSRSFTPHHPAA